jgi:hypothetical protein
LKFHLVRTLLEAGTFQTIGTAGMMAELWFNATSLGEPYRVEIYQLPGDTGYTVQIRDNDGVHAGYLAPVRRTAVSA